MKEIDRRSLFVRMFSAVADRLRTRQKLGLIKKQHNSRPRTMSEALRDSGALQMPAGRHNLTGGWGGES